MTISSCVIVLMLITEVQYVAGGAYYHISAPSEPSAPSDHYDPYSFGYDVEDNYGNKQWKQERSYNPHEVHGSYGYRDNNGIYREVTYVADKNGFRANIKSNEPVVSGASNPAKVNLDTYHTAPSHASQASASPAGFVHGPRRYSSYYNRA